MSNRKRSNRQQKIIKAADGVKFQRVRRGQTNYVQHAPQASTKAVSRSVGYQRLIDALARLASGWAFTFDALKGWLLRLGQRTVKVRCDVVWALAKLAVAAKCRKPVTA